MTSKGRSHTTGNIRMRENAYGNKKVVAITTRYRSKEHPHTMVSSSNPTSKRTGMTNTGGAYYRETYVGRRTKRR
jgi:hypothetical protein